MTSPKVVSACNWNLGALRILGRQARLSCRSSPTFGHAARALIALRDKLALGARPADGDGELEIRTGKLQRALVLQRDLERSHGVPHRRSLKSMVRLAGLKEVFSRKQLDEMQQICQAANGARHARWKADAASAPGVPPEKEIRVLRDVIEELQFQLFEVSEPEIARLKGELDATRALSRSFSADSFFEEPFDHEIPECFGVDDEFFENDILDFGSGVLGGDPALSLITIPLRCEADDKTHQCPAGSSESSPASDLPFDDLLLFVREFANDIDPALVRLRQVREAIEDRFGKVPEGQWKELRGLIPDIVAGIADGRASRCPPPPGSRDSKGDCHDPDFFKDFKKQKRRAGDG